MRPKLPPQAQLARWALKYGPLVLPYAKKLYDQGRFRQLAVMHARTLTDGTFSWEMHDAERVWVVWTGDEVVATYPDRPDLADAEGHPFPAAVRDRRVRPDELPTSRAKQALSDLSLPWTGEGADADGSPDAAGSPADDAPADPER